jgi:hypothetical protein
LGVERVGGGSGGGARLVENKGKRVSVEAGLQGIKCDGECGERGA